MNAFEPKETRRYFVEFGAEGERSDAGPFTLSYAQKVVETDEDQDIKKRIWTRLKDGRKLVVQ